MALGKVTVNALNLMQGPFLEIEKFLLFIGEGPENQDTHLFLNNDSDLDAELGSADSELKRNVKAARANAGQNWSAVVAPVADGTLWAATIDHLMNEDIRVEGVVITTPVSTAAELTAMHTKAMEINGQFGRRLFFLATARAIDSTPGTGESWSEYISDINDLTDSISAFRVGVVPYIYDDAVGILAGRLCNDQTSVSDTPMKVATGALIGQDQSTFPLDKNGVRYSNAHGKALNDQRFSVPQVYPDYEGVYWTDGQMLDVQAGDYQVIENLRVSDKAARRVRIVMIGLIGNRSFNSTPTGDAWAKSKFMRPLREMSKSYTFQGIPFPADLKKPKEGDIAINWITRTKVDVYLNLKPYEIPKDLTANIVLDLSAPNF